MYICLYVCVYRFVCMYACISVHNICPTAVLCISRKFKRQLVAVAHAQACNVECKLAYGYLKLTAFAIYKQECIHTNIHTYKYTYI